MALKVIWKVLYIHRSLKIPVNFSNQASVFNLLDILFNTLSSLEYLCFHFIELFNLTSAFSNESIDWKWKPIVIVNSFVHHLVKFINLFL